MEIITQQQTLFSLLAVVCGLALSIGIGASGVASLMGTAVGGGAISVRQAVLLAALMEFAGAYLAGGQVTG
ncbi:MAG TPA: inorganic phosphate transporter, partial [Accumulibacter sp.]|nr:inorganic phosphate transporter [Accumulibacter sp.]